MEKYFQIFLSSTNITRYKARFDSLHNIKKRLNSGSIPEFNNKCGFDSRIYYTKILQKIKISKEQWLLFLKPGNTDTIQ